MTSFLTTMALALALSVSLVAQDIKSIALPKPDTTGGKPLMQVLKERHSTREFSADTLPMPILSNLLWAACGINRDGEGKRTAPSAMNWQEIDVYVATAHGVFLYDPAKHALLQVLSDDVREKTGMQPFVKDVPINLVYVADMAKVSKASDADKSFYTGADAAFVSENVYLYCASAGLATVVRGSVDREAMAKVLKLRADQKVILAQSVGYPKK
jgi:SagB-type dehydrogenase family enzyme